MAKHFASLRTNLRFDVEPKTAELKPTIEIILLTYKPEYVLKGNTVERKNALDESRFEIPGSDLNKLIAELQLAANQLNPFTQAGEAINTILKSSKSEEKK